MGIFVALGSNIGRPRERLGMALERLTEQRGIRLVRCSSFYLTKPWGVVDQPPFWNAVARIETDLEPRILLERLRAIEREVGRRFNAERWGPREIDLDLLLYHARQIDESGLHVPHKRMKERAFVLAPLLEICPEAGEPGTALPYSECLARVLRPGDILRRAPARMPISTRRSHEQSTKNEQR